MLATTSVQLVVVIPWKFIRPIGTVFLADDWSMMLANISSFHTALKLTIAQEAMIGLLSGTMMPVKICQVVAPSI